MGRLISACGERRLQWLSDDITTSARRRQYITKKVCRHYARTFRVMGYLIISRYLDKTNSFSCCVRRYMTQGCQRTIGLFVGAKEVQVKSLSSEALHFKKREHLLMVCLSRVRCSISTRAPIQNLPPPLLLSGNAMRLTRLVGRRSGVVRFMSCLYFRLGFATLHSSRLQAHNTLRDHTHTHTHSRARSFHLIHPNLIHSSLLRRHHRNPYLLST